MFLCRTMILSLFYEIKKMFCQVKNLFKFSEMNKVELSICKSLERKNSISKSTKTLQTFSFMDNINSYNTLNFNIFIKDLQFT